MTPAPLFKIKGLPKQSFRFILFSGYHYSQAVVAVASDVVDCFPFVVVDQKGAVVFAVETSAVAAQVFVAAFLFAIERCLFVARLFAVVEVLVFDPFLFAVFFCPIFPGFLT